MFQGYRNSVFSVHEKPAEEEVIRMGPFLGRNLPGTSH